MVDIIAEPELSFLDEPLFTRPFTLTPRRLLYLGAYGLLAYTALTRLPPGPLIPLPGLEIEAGIVHLAVLLVASPLLALAFWDTPVRPETQLAWLLLGRKTTATRRPKARRTSRERQEEKEEAKPDKPKTLRLRAGPQGYAALTLTGRVEHETTITVVVNGAELRRLKASGTWTVRVELEPGEHLVEVRSLEPPTTLAAYQVIVAR